jgi:hypothetical protein
MPSGNFDFVDEIHIFISAQSLPRVEIARLAPVPKGKTTIDLEVVPGVDLLPYVNAGRAAVGDRDGAAADQDVPVRREGRRHNPYLIECICVARCEEMKSQPAPGQACTTDGSWVCQHYGARNGNHATFCAPANWNLCTR